MLIPPIHVRRLLIGIVCAVLLFVAGTAFWECYTESVVFDKKKDRVELKRMHLLTMSSKVTFHNMSHIARVYAALRGVKKGNNDMTFYVLILKLTNGQTLKILETKNASKIRREVSCLCVFNNLNHHSCCSSFV